MKKSIKQQILRDKLQGRSTHVFSQRKDFYKGNGTIIYSVWGWLYKDKEELSIKALIGFNNVLFTDENGVQSEFEFTFSGIKSFLKKLKSYKEYSKYQSV